MFIRSGYSAQTRSTGGTGTQQHHLAADVVVGRSDGRPPAATQSDALRLGLELVTGQAVEPDHVLLDRSRARRADPLAPALEHKPFAVGAHGRRQAPVHDAVDLA